MTRLRRNIFMFAAVIIIFSAMLADYIVLKSYSNVNYNFINTLSSIYLDKSDLDDETYEKLKKLTLSGNTKIYEALLKNKNNPVAVFYAFSGLLKTNQTEALTQIKSDILLSPMRLNIVKDNKSINETLGYAILQLLLDSDLVFSTTLSKNFIESSEDKIYNAFKSPQEAFANSVPYRDSLYNLIIKTYKNVTNKIIPELTNVESYEDINYNQKYAISAFIDFFDKDNKNSIINAFMKDKDNDFKLLALSQITEDSDNSFTAPLEKLVRYEKNKDVLIEAIKKFALLTKENSLTRIKNTIYLNQNVPEVVVAGLEQIAKYGESSEYEYLTIFLGKIYPIEVNNAALDAIFEAVYSREPTKPAAAFAFIIGRSDASTAKKVIDFYIKNNLSNHRGTIIYRLSQEEAELKETALEYIEHFKLKENISLVEKLTSDTNEEIAEKAKKILEELK